MRRRFCQAAIVALPAFLFIAGALWVLSLFSGLFTVEIGGRRVRRQTSWYFHQIAFIPYPVSRMVVCYAYWDEQGRKVVHGPCDNFDEKGHLTARSHYVDGRLTDEISFYESGEPRSAIYWKDDKKIGEADYRNGEINSSQQIIFNKQGDAIAEKLFYDHKWSLHFRCGVDRDREIDEHTGEMRELPNVLPPPSNCLKKLEY